VCVCVCVCVEREKSDGDGVGGVFAWSDHGVVMVLHCGYLCHDGPHVRLETHILQ
jgi:hypothetical protein